MNTRNRNYSIGFFTAAMIAVVAISGAYQISYEKALDRAKEELLTAEHEVSDPPAVATEGEATKGEIIPTDDCYYLMEVNGYVVVFLADKKTAYEYTNIEVQSLPSTLQNEVKNGKYIEDIESLYGFLENYSS